MPRSKYVVRDGTVYRQTIKGDSEQVITEREAGDYEEFREEHPEASIEGEAHVRSQTRDPHDLTVNEGLPEYLATIDSVDAILQMKERDTRSSADRAYDARIREILSPEPQDPQDDEPTEDGGESEE